MSLASDLYMSAHNYYELALAQGKFKAASHLGFLAWKGLGEEKNIDKAQQLLHLGIDANHSLAMYNLGCMYFQHDIPGLSDNEYYEKATEWISKARRSEPNNLNYAYALNRIQETNMRT